MDTPIDEKMGEIKVWWNWGITLDVSTNTLEFLFRSLEGGETIETCQFNGDMTSLKSSAKRLYENVYTIHEDTASETISYLTKRGVNVPHRFCELVEKYDKMTTNEVTRLKEKIKEKDEIIAKLASNVSSIAVMKIKECRDEIVDAQTQMFQSMDNCFKFVSIPMTVSLLIIPLARRFLDWRIGYTTHEGNGAAYIAVNGDDEEYEYGLIIWKNLGTPEPLLHIVCDVEEGFRLNGWTSNEMTVPENQGFDGLVAIYNQLKIEAPIFLMVFEERNVAGIKDVEKKMESLK